MVALLLTAPVVPAQDDAAQQRARIERERAHVELRSRQAEAACERRFAVSACLAEARAERRAALHQLDQQRVLLDDAQRKQRAADRQARIQQRQEEQARADEQRQPPAPGRASPPPTGTASSSGVDKANDPGRRTRTAAEARREQAQADKRAAAAQRRAAQAAEHRAAVERRNAQRAAEKAPSPPLPVPSAPQAASSVRP
jgi:colicin import membrane protein